MALTPLTHVDGPSLWRPSAKERNAARSLRGTCSAWVMITLLLIACVTALVLVHDRQNDIENERANADAYVFSECDMFTIEYPTSLPPSDGWVETDGCQELVACIKVMVYMPHLGYLTTMQMMYPNVRECTRYGLCSSNRSEQLSWVRGTVIASYPHPPTKINCYTNGQNAYYEDPEGPENNDYLWVIFLTATILVCGVAILVTFCMCGDLCNYCQRRRHRLKENAKRMQAWKDQHNNILVNAENGMHICIDKAIGNNVSGNQSTVL